MFLESLAMDTGCCASRRLHADDSQRETLTRHPEKNYLLELVPYKEGPINSYRKVKNRCNIILKNGKQENFAMKVKMKGAWGRGNQGCGKIY